MPVAPHHSLTLLFYCDKPKLSPDIPKKSLKPVAFKDTPSVLSSLWLSKLIITLSKFQVKITKKILKLILRFYAVNSAIN